MDGRGWGVGGELRVSGVVYESCGEETVLVACCFECSPDGLRPPARGKNLKEIMSRVGGISQIFSCLHQRHGGVQEA